jgi:uncharacterized membrane protein YdbT with pleckstrin-like domain
MGLSPKHLYDDEVVVFDRHPHWWFLVPRASALALAVAFGVFVGVIYKFEKDSTLAAPIRIFAALLLLAALGWFLFRLIAWRTTNFVVTTERCIYRNGVMKKTGIEIPLDRINTVFFSQTFFERLLKAGDIAIESAGEGSRQSFSDVYDPVEVQNTIYREMEANERRRYGRFSDGGGGETPARTSGAPQLSVAEQIEKLVALRDGGVLTEEEFQHQKSVVLGRNPGPESLR